jgi:hypothetical protein
MPEDCQDETARRARNSDIFVIELGATKHYLCWNAIAQNFPDFVEILSFERPKSNDGLASADMLMAS